MKTAAIAIALALAVSTLNTLAQDAPRPEGRPPREGGPQGGPGQGGFHLLPPRAHEHLKLTDDQKKQIEELEAEVKAKLEKILTPEQLEQLKHMRPPMHQGQGGPGGGQQRGGGPGGGGDSEGQPKRQRPPSE